jgi:hypothetical protein
MYSLNTTHFPENPFLFVIIITCKYLRDLSKNLRRNFGGFRELQLFAETVEGISIPISILVTDPSFQPSFSQLISYSSPKIIITDSLFQPYSCNWLHSDFRLHSPSNCFLIPQCTANLGLVSIKYKTPYWRYITIPRK